MNNLFEQSLNKNPAVVVCFLFAVGIALGWYFIADFPATLVIIFLFGLLIAAIIFKKASFYFLIPIFILSGALQIYFSLATFKSNHLILQEYQKAQVLEGWISDAQYRSDGKHRYVLEAEKIIFNSTEKRVCGKILLFQGKSPAILNYGQRIQFYGALQQSPLPGNPGEFNFRKYLQMNKIFFQAVLDEDNFIRMVSPAGNWITRSFLVPTQQFIRHTIEQNIPTPTAAVVRALVLGERQDIDRSILEQFQRSGIVHVLAISGLHVGFILMVLLLFFGLIGLSYNKRVLFSLLLLFAFVALVNFKAPVLRATLMATLYYAANWSERKVSSLNTIAIAALLILMIDPAQLLLPGFQFSFAAVSGILYGYPRLKTIAAFRIKNRLIQKWLVQPFVVSLTAVLATTPLTWFYYGTLQTGAVFINVLLIPLIGFFVVLNFIFIIVSALGLGISSGFGQILHLWFSFILKLNGMFASLPFVQIQAPKPGILAILLLIVFIFLIFHLKRETVIYTVATLILLVLLQIRPDPKFRVTFVSVGQGDGAIVEFPNGKVLVLDAGDRNFGFDAGKRYVLPLLKYYGINKIDYLVATHAHSDHFGGMLSVLNSVPVDTIYLSTYSSPNKLYQRFIALIDSLKIPVIHKQRGQEINIGSEYRVYILHPFGPYLHSDNHSGNEVNNSSLVLKIYYGRTSFLFMGDLEQNAEEGLIPFRSLLTSNVFKVGHHGSRTSSSTELLHWVSADYSVVSVGRRNRFYHPSRQTMNRLQMNNARPLRTDHFGAIVFESDGKKVELVNWR